MHFKIRMGVYAQAENIGRFGTLQTPIEAQLRALSRVCSNPSVAAAAQLDLNTGSSFRIVLDPQGRTKPEQLGETNTGDPAELVQFCAWLDETIPADFDAVILSGHGLGWLTSLAGWAMSSRALLPNTSANGQADLLTTSELADALRAIGTRRGRPVNVLVFDACLMETIEVLFSLKGVADAVVGTPDELSGRGYNLAGAAQLLSTDAAHADSVQIARAFVRSYTPTDPADLCVAVNLNRLDTASIVEGMRAFGQAMRSIIPRRVGELRAMLSWASNQLTRFGGNGLADVASLRAAANRVPGLDTSGLTRVTAALHTAVVDRRAGSGTASMLGISIASPVSDTQWQRDRADYLALPFCVECGWGTVLDLLFPRTDAVARSILHATVK